MGRVDIRCIAAPLRPLLWIERARGLFRLPAFSLKNAEEDLDKAITSSVVCGLSGGVNDASKLHVGP